MTDYAGCRIFKTERLRSYTDHGKGEKEETRLLQDLLQEEEPQFVAVFGRRRIGKTYLVRESFHHQFTFQHTGISNLSIRNESKKQAQIPHGRGNMCRSERIRLWKLRTARALRLDGEG